VTVAATPDELDTRAWPADNVTTMLPDENTSVALESASTSTRPSFPRLTTAFEPAAAAITAPDMIVELETAGCPLTVTSPVTVVTLTFCAAFSTLTLPVQRLPLIAELSNERANVVFGPSSMRPALPRFRIAPAPSCVAIVLEENIVRPLLATSPFTVTES